MTTGIEELKPIRHRGGRGPAKKPTFVHVSLRLPREVVDYFKVHHPNDTQKKAREILTAYVNSQTQGANNG